MKRAGHFLLLFALLLLAVPAQAATTLLPNGKQCFSNANGPLIAGSLNMFYPATTTAKPTWQDANQVTLNSQPIQLDSDGCAVIYGIGSYRQQVYTGPVVGGSTTGSLVFDQLTTDTSAYDAVYWAGLAGGTPNIITITDPGFNATDGSVINFVALSNNTGSVTLNPSGFGAISIVKDTASGPASLIGGELIAGNVISVVYSASGNNFHLLNAAIPSPSGNTAPLCGASNLKIVNSAVTPNTIITITADYAVTISTGGLVSTRTAVSTTVNTGLGNATSAVGGMDGEAVGTSQWLYVWLIDNGAAIGGLASTTLTPTMPSGYNYKCRVGAVRVDGSGLLLRTIQRGALAQYVVSTPSNTSNLPQIVAGTNGTYSATAPAWGAAVSIAAFVPPTAAQVTTVLAFLTGIGAEQAIVAPNANYAGITSINPPPCFINTAGVTAPYGICTMMIETPSAPVIYYSSNGAHLQVNAFGWRDQVNAN